MTTKIITQKDIYYVKESFETVARAINSAISENRYFAIFNDKTTNLPIMLNLSTICTVESIQE